VADAAAKGSREGRPTEVNPADDDLRRKMLAAVFTMPSVQTMVSRKSSITNAFVNSVIPVIPPTVEEIEEALAILGMEVASVCCTYCGNPMSEWDHLRPLVVKRRPTGFITEIANLVPACGKCNQSKGNKPWRAWMLSNARLSPTGRNVPDVAQRVARLDAYEKWRPPTIIEFESILGGETWEHYWSLCENVNDELRKCQEVATSIRSKIIEALQRQ
jgi:HNH endonuclease